MVRTKISIDQIELVRVLNGGDPDIVVHIFDYDWGSGYVDGYLWETFERRTRAQADVGMAVASLVKKGFLKFVTVHPKFLHRIFGAKSEDYGYLTPTGREAAINPAIHLGEPLKREDYDHRYEPKGMWLRQIQGLPPRTD